MIEPGRLKWLAGLAVLGGVALRMQLAWQTSLNPDEALIMAIAQPTTWFRDSLYYHHPPFFYFLLHAVERVSTSELALRMVPVLAGALFPWFLMKWLQVLQFPHAALTAILLLEFSPNLITLSAQVRGYTLTLLLVAVALWVLEKALVEKSTPLLWVSSGLVVLAILTEYSAAFAVGGMGIYVLWRLFIDPLPRSWMVSWGISQAVGLGLYAWLYRISVAPLLADATTPELITGYLSGAFPQPLDDRLWFALSNTTQQFAYALASTPMGALGQILFVAGMAWLWSGGVRRRALVGLLVAPFLIALAAAWWHVHPYGRSRHTVILGVLGVSGIALAGEFFWRRFPGSWIAMPLVLLAASYRLRVPDQNDMPRELQERTAMVEAVRELRWRLPADAVVLMDRETSWILRYYLTDRLGPVTHTFKKGKPIGVNIPGLNGYAVRWLFRSLGESREDAATLRDAMHLPSEQRIWVVDGGFAVLPAQMPSAEMLSGSLLLFRDP